MRLRRPLILLFGLFFFVIIALLIAQSGTEGVQLRCETGIHPADTVWFNPSFQNPQGLPEEGSKRLPFTTWAALRAEMSNLRPRYFCVGGVITSPMVWNSNEIFHDELVIHGYDNIRITVGTASAAVSVSGGPELRTLIIENLQFTDTLRGISVSGLENTGVDITVRNNELTCNTVCSDDFRSFVSVGPPTSGGNGNVEIAVNGLDFNQSSGGSTTPAGAAIGVSSSRTATVRNNGINGFNGRGLASAINVASVGGVNIVDNTLSLRGGASWGILVALPFSRNSNARIVRNQVTTVSDTDAVDIGIEIKPDASFPPQEYAFGSATISENGVRAIRRDGIRTSSIERVTLTRNYLLGGDDSLTPVQTGYRRSGNCMRTPENIDVQNNIFDQLNFGIALQSFPIHPSCRENPKVYHNTFAEVEVGMHYTGGNSARGVLSSWLVDSRNNIYLGRDGADAAHRVETNNSATFFPSDYNQYEGFPLVLNNLGTGNQLNFAQWTAGTAQTGGPREAEGSINLDTTLEPPRLPATGSDALNTGVGMLGVRIDFFGNSRGSQPDRGAEEADGS